MSIARTIITNQVSVAKHSRRQRVLLASVLALPTLTSVSLADNQYFDVNGATDGSGIVADSSYSFAGTFWGSDAAGTSATVAYDPTNIAIFSAGTDATASFTINAGAPATPIPGLTVEEGTLTLRANIPVAGDTTVMTGATISIESSLRIGGTGAIVLDGGTLLQTNPGNAGSFAAATKELRIGASGSGTVNYSSSSTGTVSIYSGTITGLGGTTTNGGTGTLVKTGNLEVRYQGAGTQNSTYSKLVVKGGLFRLGSVTGANYETGFGAVPTAPLADAITLDGGAIGTSYGVTTNVNRGIFVTANGGTINTTAASFTSGGAITGGPLTINGTTNGVVLANTPNTITQLLGTGPITVNSSKVLNVGGDNSSFTYSGVVAGAGTFNKTGTGTLSVALKDWTNTGATNIQAGTIKYNDPAAGLSSGSTVAISAGATLDMNNVNDTIGMLSGAGSVINAGNLTLASGATATFSGTLSGTGNLTKTGTGTLTLSGTNNLSGTTTINAGTIRYNNANAVGGSGASLTVNAGATAAAGYAIDQAFVDRLATSSAGVVAVAAASSNNLNLSADPALRLGAVGAVTYSGTLTPGASYRLGGGGGTLNLAHPLIDNLDVNVDGNGTTVGTVAFTVGAGTSRIATLTVAAAGKFNVTNNALVLTNTGQTDLRALLLTGRAADGSDVGAWTGTGVISSTAAADADKLTAIGYLTAGNKGVTDWNGVTGLASTDVITLVTKYGDINLDGKVDADDLALLDRGNAQYITGVVAANSAVWLNGDFNYDGIVDAKDYFLADKSYGKATGQLAAGFLAAREAQFGEAYVSSLIAAVPEPTSLGLACAGAAAFLGRRRRNAR